MKLLKSEHHDKTMSSLFMKKLIYIFNNIIRIFIELY